jgi:hypothetical protein
VIVVKSIIYRCPNTNSDHVVGDLDWKFIELQTQAIILEVRCLCGNPHPLCLLR